MRLNFLFVARLLVGRYFCFLLITICWLLATLCWLVVCDEMWGEDGLQVYGICSHQLVYIDIVKAWSDYKKSYFWWFRNPTYGDSTGRNQIEND